MSSDEPIVISIEGEAAGADEGLSAAGEAAAALQEQLAALAEAAAEMSANIEASFAAVATAADDLAGSLSAASGALDTSGTSADGAAGSMDALSGAADSAAAAVTAEGDAAADAAVKTKGLNDANNITARGAGKLRMPLLLAGAAVIGLGALSVKMAGDFRSSMTQLVTGAGESQNAIGMVSSSILQMAGQTGESTKQLAAGMFMIDSAGYIAAKGGLTVLRDAAEGAKVGNADLGTVADATTTILNDFGKKGISAANAVNALIATEKQGKVHLQDLATSLSQILPTAAAANVHLNDVMGAMAAMTAEGVPAANAATYLRQTILALDAPSAAAKKALASIGLTTQDVSAAMQRSLPSAIAMITDRLAKKFPVGSAAYVNALKDISGGSKTMQGMLDLSGQHLALFQSSVQGVTQQVKAGGQSIVGWSTVQKDFNQQMAELGASVESAMIAVGSALMPVIQLIGNGLRPVLEWMAAHAKIVAIGMGILAAAIIGALVPVLNVMIGEALALNTALLPEIGIAAAIAAGIALLAAGVIFAYTHFKPFRDAVQAVGHALGQLASFIRSHIGPALHLIGTFVKPLVTALQGSLGQTLHQLGETFRTQLLPAWHQLQAAFVQIMPYLKLLGAIIGGYILIQIGLFIGLLKGVLSAIGPLASGLIRMLGGAFQVVAGIVRIFSAIVGGTVQLIVDLIHGKWGKLGSDVLAIWNGIKAGIGMVLSGLWNIIAGFFGGLLGAVGGFLSGFVSGVIGFFQHLFEKLVGHSIIPDLIKGIISFFASLPGKVLSLVAGLVSGVIGHMAQMATGVIAHVARMVPGVGGLLDLLHHTANDKTAIMRDEVAARADEMKARSLVAFAAMQMGAARHFDQMRQKLIAEIKNTRDPVKRHALEMQLAVVTSAEKMHEGAAKAAEAMAQKVTAHAQEMAADAKAKAADMHDGVIGRVTDMAGNVVSAAAQLPGKVLGAVLSLDQKLVAFFAGLATKALSWGANLIGNLVSGITSKIGDVKNAVGNIAGAIGSFLGFHSPAKEGPGAQADTWAPNFMRMFAAGITANAGLVRAAATAAASGLAVGFGAGGINAPHLNASGAPGFSAATAAVAAPVPTAATAPSGGGNSQATAQILAQMVAEQRQTNTLLGQVVGNTHGGGASGASGGGGNGSPAGTASGSAAGVVLNNATFQGVTDITALYRALNALSGLAAENALRGAVAGLAS